ncbi:MAG: hypothetical protein ACI9W2_004842 [Gammaproteobacteria bacterium]|jgi:hypothetical protein
MGAFSGRIYAQTDTTSIINIFHGNGRFRDPHTAGALSLATSVLHATFTLVRVR